jgi:transposase
MKNKYIKVTHISERKTREIIRLFSLDIEAKKTAELAGVSRQTINKFYNAFRERIAEICEAEAPFENGEIELDESFFGARRVRGKRGRGAAGKIPVFGMLKRGERVYTQIVKNCSVRELLPIIRGKADTDELSTPMVFGHMTDWLIMDIKSIIGLNIATMNLRRDTNILTVSRTSGDYAKYDSQSSGEYTNICSFYTSKSVNLDTTTETKIFT